MAFYISLLNHLATTIWTFDVDVTALVLVVLDKGGRSFHLFMYMIRQKIEKTKLSDAQTKI